MSKVEILFRDCPHQDGEPKVLVTQIFSDGGEESSETGPDPHTLKEGKVLSLPYVNPWLEITKENGCFLLKPKEVQTSLFLINNQNKPEPFQDTVRLTHHDSAFLVRCPIGKDYWEEALQIVTHPQ